MRGFDTARQACLPLGVISTSPLACERYPVYFFGSSNGNVPHSPVYESPSTRDDDEISVRFTNVTFLHPPLRRSTRDRVESL
jgi:hypothetical protein